MPDECRGRYDPAIYTTLDNICEDCYNLYKDSDVHHMCRFPLRLELSIVKFHNFISGQTASAQVSSVDAFRLEMTLWSIKRSL